MSDKGTKKRIRARVVFEITLVLLIIMMVTFYYFEKTNFFDLQPVETPGGLSDDNAESLKAKYEFSNREAKYLEMDGEYFRPADVLTHAEFAKMVYVLLGTEKMGTDTYLDLDADDEIYKQAVTLKTLGLFEGARFHKDEPTTFSEFNHMLNSFGYSCDDLEKDMTRRDAALIMSKVLDRDLETDFEEVGTILDVPKDDEAFFAIADAALDYTLSIRGNGYFYQGDDLRYIDSNGVVAANREVDGFMFDGNGIYTSGSSELDKLVKSTLHEVLSENKDYKYFEPNGNIRFRSEDSLKKVYYHIVNHANYVPGELHEVGDTSWVNDAAYQMLSTYKGNCYCFAGAFYAMARQLGFEAEIFSGTFSHEHDPHSWVEIEIDGETFLFDPEIEYTRTMGEGISFYKRDESFVHKYDYKKEID